MLKDLISGFSGSFAEGSHTELRAQTNKTRRANLLNGDLTSNSRSESTGVCARVYKNGFYGFSSAVEYTPSSCRNVLNAAAANADYYASRLLSDKQGLPPLKNGSYTVNEGINDPEQKYYIDFIREIDNYIAKTYPDLSSRSVTAYADSMEKLLCVSNGFNSHSVLPRSYVYVSLTAFDNENQPVEFFKPIGGFGTFDVNFKDPAALFPEIDAAYRYLCDKKQAVYAKAGLKTCILGPLMTGMLAHEAVGHTVEADLVLGGSVAGPNLGKIVASEKISLVDFANTALGKPVPLPVYVDDEGTEAKDALLIDKGRLVGYMNSRETADRFNMTPLGNARAYGFYDEPLIRMRNTAVLPGTDSLEKMIESVDDGYYLLDSNNGQADTTGEFMFGVTLGYEIKHGKIGKSIKDTTISGVAFEMLKTVDMVSDEMQWTSCGFCEKKQPMPVGMGGPSIKCRVNIGGR